MLDLSPHLEWQAGPETPQLAPGEVHLWRATLTEPQPGLYDTLSTAEHVRAGRFYQERDRQRFITAHGVLRSILGRYLETDPRHVEFAAGPFGKPLLMPNFRGIHFNLSHSDNLMLLAVARTREVGVDVELMRSDVPFESLAEHYFEPTEAWSIRTAPNEERATRFYEMWTSTEARLKAAGTGFADPGTVVQLDRWSLLTLTPASGYAAALAVEGDGFDLQCWSWPN